MPKEPVNEDNSTITTEDLKLFAEILCGTGEVFKAIAEWLEASKIASVRGTGMPTARKGCGYLSNFVATVLNAYHTERLNSPIPGIAPKTVVKAGEIRSLAKKVATAEKKAIDLADEGVKISRAKKAQK